MDHMAVRYPEYKYGSIDNDDVIEQYNKEERVNSGALEDGSRDIGCCCDSKTENDHYHQLAVRWLVVAAWIGTILFGTFTVGHYLWRSLVGDWEAWETTDPGLYRPRQRVANDLMVCHFVPGVVLMTLGPIQLIPWIRRHYLDWHRFLGRLYISAALMAAGCATLFVVIYGTSRADPYEDWGNILFGSLVLICAVQSYRHAALTKKIELHKKWSWRLYSLIFGVLLFRLEIMEYFVFVMFTSWQGNIALYESLYFLFYLPNLVVVEVLWWWQGQNQRQRERFPIEWRTIVLVLSAFFVATTSLTMFFLVWLPSIQGKAALQSQALNQTDAL